jgi:DNA-binding winged helix-turn-helix (wHTH) protein
MDVNASTGADNPLRFGSFALDVRSRELRNGAMAAVRLQEQPFEILRMLLERRGDVVTRDELHRRLWPRGTFVDFDHSLNAAVKRLRAALGDHAERPRFVETLPRRGYRFIGPLAEDATQVQGMPVAVPRVRMAVLPFTNLSTGSGHGSFVDGLTEEMIAQLGQLFRGRLGVISRSSSMMFRDGGRRARDIGQALRVDYLLEGSVRRDGGTHDGVVQRVQRAELRTIRAGLGRSGGFANAGHR